MKFTPTTALAALGLAGHAVANAPAHAIGGPALCKSISTVLVTSTKTATVTKSATGAGGAAVTVTVTSTISAVGGATGGSYGGNGGSGSGSGTTTVAGGSGNTGSGNGGNGGNTGSGNTGSGNGGNGGNTGSGNTGSGNGGNGGSGGSGGVGVGSIISTIGTTGTNGYIMSTTTIGSTTSQPPPTYTPGQGTNVTTPVGGSTSTNCNSASDRQSWCGGFDINSDYSTTWPNTGKTCHYSLTLTNTTCNFDGTSRACLAVNGQVPGPAIECNWGDNVVIDVTNGLTDNGTAIHWHGIRQLGTNPNDGVPGVTECALAPGETRTYSWQATQYGSSWYHSHYLVQYGDGIRGPIIIHGPATANYDYDMGSVLVDDLFNLTASQMNSLISHNGALNAHNYLLNGKNTSPDLKTGQHAQWTVQSGKKYLFRIVNSAAQNSWWMHFDQHNMTVIAADFVPIVPYTTSWLAIATGQRYDVIITADQPVSNYFFRAVTQLACPSGTDNTGLGAANGIISYAGGNTTLLPTSTYGNVSASFFATCQDEPIASLVPWIKKTAGSSSLFTNSTTTLPAGNVTKVATSDDGAVFRWFLNGNSFINVNWTQPTLESLAQNNTKAISNAIILPQTSVQWVYFVIQNVFAPAHPMHLHGHDFSLLGQGTGTFVPSTMTSTLNFDNPPRRDTAMLMGGTAAGGGYTVIGFETDNPGAWLMHCHIAWHADGGLAMQFVERQDEIPAVQWTSNASFQDQCDAYESFNSLTGKGIKTSGESGLKRRWFEEDAESSVVRKSERSEKKYLENIARGLGDGYKPRHVRR